MNSVLAFACKFYKMIKLNKPYYFFFMIFFFWKQLKFFLHMIFDTVICICISLLCLRFPEFNNITQLRSSVNKRSSEDLINLLYYEQNWAFMLLKYLVIIGLSKKFQAFFASANLSCAWDFFFIQKYSFWQNSALGSVKSLTYHLFKF